MPGNQPTLIREKKVIIALEKINFVVHNKLFISGIELLEELCKQNLHLKVTPRFKLPKVRVTIIFLLALTLIILYKGDVLLALLFLLFFFL